MRNQSTNATEDRVSKPTGKKRKKKTTWDKTTPNTLTLYELDRIKREKKRKQKI